MMANHTLSQSRSETLYYYLQGAPDCKFRIGLENRAGRGEHARQWRQEQEDREVDVMIEGLDEEVEA